VQALKALALEWLAHAGFQTVRAAPHPPTRTSEASQPGALRVHRTHLHRPRLCRALALRGEARTPTYEVPRPDLEWNAPDDDFPMAAREVRLAFSRTQGARRAFLSGLALEPMPPPRQGRGSRVEFRLRARALSAQVRWSTLAWHAPGRVCDFLQAVPVLAARAKYAASAAPDPAARRRQRSSRSPAGLRPWPATT
jgi:hypothetical protein